MEKAGTGRTIGEYDWQLPPMARFPGEACYILPGGWRERSRAQTIDLLGSVTCGWGDAPEGIKGLGLPREHRVSDDVATWLAGKLVRAAEGEVPAQGVPGYEQRYGTVMQVIERMGTVLPAGGDEVSVDPTRPALIPEAEIGLGKYLPLRQVGQGLGIAVRRLRESGQAGDAYNLAMLLLNSPDVNLYHVHRGIYDLLSDPSIDVDDKYAMIELYVRRGILDNGRRGEYSGGDVRDGVDIKEAALMIGEARKESRERLAEEVIESLPDDLTKCAFRGPLLAVMFLGEEKRGEAQLKLAEQISAKAAEASDRLLGKLYGDDTRAYIELISHCRLEDMPRLFRAVMEASVKDELAYYMENWNGTGPMSTREPMSQFYGVSIRDMTREAYESLYGPIPEYDS